MQKSLILISFVLIFCFKAAIANVVQILHTNDLHSQLDHASHHPEVGGYARLKVFIDQKKQWAAEQGMGTIAMDAGDYTEGNIYYLAEKGIRTFRLYDSIGLDVGVIGNHDYLMGTADLDKLFEAVPTKIQMLGANFNADPRYKAIKNSLKPYYEKVVNGVKIGVVGVTLSGAMGMLYDWRLEKKTITDANTAAIKYAKILRERGNEVIIALTHIGLSADKKLAKEESEIDIIVGGHSHDEMKEIFWQKSKNGKRIPIVQTGDHGNFLGQLIFDYDKSSKKLTVQKYGLLPVISVEKDAGILTQIESANFALYDLFGEGWLNQTMGQSKLRPTHQGGNYDIWQYFITDSMMESAKTDFAINVSAMSGTNFPLTGPISRRDLYNSNPRHFEFDFKYGYDIYSASVSGVWISLISRVTMRLGVPMYYSGLEFDYKDKGGKKFSISNLKNRGKKLKLTKDYTVALSEGIVRGGFAITPWVKLLLKKHKHHPISMWKALEDHLVANPVVEESYLQDHFGKRTSEHAKIVPYLD